MATKAPKAGTKKKNTSSNKLKQEDSDKQESCLMTGLPDDEGDDDSGFPAKNETDMSLDITTESSLDNTGTGQTEFTPAQPPGPSATGGTSPRKAKLYQQNRSGESPRKNESPGKKNGGESPGSQSLGNTKSGVSPSRYRIEKDDPSLLAYDAKVAERRAADRARQEKLDAKAKTLQEEMERKQQEHADEAARLIEAEQRARREAHEEKHKIHLESEAARIERLQGVTNADMDVLTGKKSTIAKFQERREDLLNEEEMDRVNALVERHEYVSGVSGQTFYEELKEHTVRCKARGEIEAVEREGTRQEFHQHHVVAPLPKEYKTTAREKVLELEKETHVDLNSTVQKKAEYARRNQTMEYARGTQKEHMPKGEGSNPLAPPPLNTTMPRDSKNTMKEGNAAIRTTSPSTTLKDAPAMGRK